jgi:hypothetical protein
MRASNGPWCECHERLGVPEVGAYERIPLEITSHAGAFDAPMRAELQELAGFVGRSDLRSEFLPHFIGRYQQHTGVRVSDAVQQIADRIGKIHRQGLHCSPSVVARTIRALADHPGMPTA